MNMKNEFKPPDRYTAINWCQHILPKGNKNQI